MIVRRLPYVSTYGTSEKARIRHQRTFHFPRRYRISQMPNHGKGDFSEVPYHVHH